MNAKIYRYGGQLLASHEYSTGQFFVVFVAIVLSAQSSGQLFAHSLGKSPPTLFLICRDTNIIFPDIMKGKNAYNAVRSLQLSVPRDMESDESNLDAEKLSSASPLIEFKNAKFAYPARPSQPILRGLDLKV